MNPASAVPVPTQKTTLETAVLQALEPKSIIKALGEKELVPDEIAALRAVLAKYETKAGGASPAIVTELQATRESYPDNRADPEFGPHQAIAFTAKPSTATLLTDLLKGCLGDADAKVLMSDWGDRIKGDPTVGTACAALFLNSNNKARNQDYAAADARTTQQADFENTNPKHQFASDVDAIVVCAAAVKSAKDAGLDLRKEASTWAKEQTDAVAKLSPEVLDLLTKLRDGVIRSCSGALDVSVDGRLRAAFFNVRASADYWAFGARSSAE